MSTQEGEQEFVFQNELRETLSQGDLVRDIPWGVLPAPLVFCRPARVGSGREALSWTEPWESQQKPFAKGTEEVHFPARLSLGIVLWDDCQVDKLSNQGRPKERWFAAVAPVLPAKELQGGMAATLEGRVRRFFPLPKDDDSRLAQDSYVDLRHIVPVRYSLLEAKRAASMSDVGRQALMAHLFTFLTSMQVPDVCGTCGAAVGLRSAGEE